MFHVFEKIAWKGEYYAFSWTYLVNSSVLHIKKTQKQAPHWTALKMPFLRFLEQQQDTENIYPILEVNSK